MAFGPEFGEALTPVIAPGLVTGLYLISVLYMGVDVAWEAYKVHVGGYKPVSASAAASVSTQHQPNASGNKAIRGHEMSTMQKVVERGSFQLIASMAVPSFVVSTGVNTAR